MHKTRNQLNSYKLPSVAVPSRMNQTVTLEFNPVVVKEAKNPGIIAAFFEGMKKPARDARFNTVKHVSTKV